MTPVPSPTPFPPIFAPPFEVVQHGARNRIRLIGFSTLGARGLHAAHPDGRPKAGKTSGLHEANEVSEELIASDLWFQPLFPS